MPQAFGHLKEEEEKMQSTENQLLATRADIEALRLRFEEMETATCQISEESESIKGLRAMEALTQEFLENSFKDFAKDPKTATKEKIESCNNIISMIDRYRHVKVQLELLKHVKFSIVPVKQ